MTGDLSDIVRRLRAVLPDGWFGDEAPVLDTVLQALGQAWTTLYTTIVYAKDQLHVSTASGGWLDAIALDFFGTLMPRRSSEPDDAYRVRLLQELLRERATRAAISRALVDLTDRQPDIFEPGRSADTGAYAQRGVQQTTGLAYGITGGWGSLAHPFQVFVTAHRPHRSSGTASIGWGYGGYNNGYSNYCDITVVRGGVKDEDIVEAVKRVLPVATTAWIRITG